MIQAILWDIDATLLNFEKAERYAIRKCFSLLAMGECTDDMLARYSVINRKYWEKLERGELTKPEVLLGRFEEFFAAEHLDVGKAEAFNEEYQIHLGDQVFFNDNGYELIQKLKPHVKQYAVTNGTHIAQKRKLEKSGLDKLLDGVFISDQLGAEKPSLAFFNQVLAQMDNLPLSSIMIVGDSLTSDMKGGNNAGIRCCWYNPKGISKPADITIDYDIRHLWEVELLLQ